MSHSIWVDAVNRYRTQSSTSRDAASENAAAKTAGTGSHRRFACARIKVRRHSPASPVQGLSDGRNTWTFACWSNTERATNNNKNCYYYTLCCVVTRKKLEAIRNNDQTTNWGRSTRTTTHHYKLHTTQRSRARCDKYMLIENSARSRGAL